MRANGRRAASAGRATPLRGAWKVQLAQAVARLRADVSFAVIDAVLIVLAYTAAMSFRFLDDAVVASNWLTSYLIVLPVILLVHLLANMLFGTYGHVWEYASVGEALRIVGASASAVSVLLGGLLVYRGMGGVGLIPSSVLALGAMLTLGGMGAVRFRSRMFSLRRMGEQIDRPELSLVVGVGKAAADLGRYRGEPGSRTNIVGYVDPQGDGPETTRRLAGLPVLGRIQDLPDLVEVYGIDQVIMATPNAAALAREVVDLCVNVDVRFRIVPELDSVLTDSSGILDIRDLELDDLLPRSAIQTDLGNVASMLDGKRVLVTGAGGSIGSEIVRQILDFSPSMVLALDNDETHLFDAMIAWSAKTRRPYPVLADIRDKAALLRVFDEHRPEVVFHAAAHKHVPILEEYPAEAVKTNVIGTLNLLEAAVDVERFVLISTDKAVSPSNVMGATKRMAEMLLQASNGKAHTGTFCAVRFGNVLGSRGSVVPTFMRQIQLGGPVTVSDPRMERYFMTVDEAVHLVLQAAALSEGGEVFVLDMGEPVKISDLAHRLIRLAGLVPGRDIEVITSGVRPGEKMSEILSRLPLNPSAHPKIRIARPSYAGVATLFDAAEILRKMSEEGDSPGIRELVMSMASRDWSPHEMIDLSDWGYDASIKRREVG